MRKAVLAILLAVLLPLPASGHSIEEIEAWETDWFSRVEEQDFVLSIELAEEAADFRSRHRWYFYPKPVEARVAPVAYSGPIGVEQWRSKVALYFPDDQVDRALRVMACESGGNPSAYNRSGASGLMQVLSSWADNFGYQPADLFDPDTNLYIASLLYFDGGWRHWVCKG